MVTTQLAMPWLVWQLCTASMWPIVACHGKVQRIFQHATCAPTRHGRAGPAVQRLLSQRHTQTPRIRTNMTLSSGRCRCDHAVPCRASLRTSGISPSLTADPHTDTLPVLHLLSMCRNVLTNHTREHRHVTLLVFAWLEQFDLAVYHRHHGPLTPSLTTSPSPYLGLTARVCLTQEFDPACPPLPTLGLAHSLTL
jgi:hypothetical protein